MLLEPAGSKAQHVSMGFDTHHNREKSQNKGRNMLVIGLIVSLLLVVICYIALSGGQPKVIDNDIPSTDKNHQKDQEQPNKDDDK